jgi:predicted Zn-dependent protease
VAIPGGYIFIFKELIEKTTDDELANVIAHEIAHIEARHSVKKLQAVLGYSLLVNIAFRGENYAEIVRYSNLIFDLVLKGYSRRDEFEADSTGVVLAYRAGYKPEAMISFLNKLKKLNENSGLEIEFLSTHPSYDNRMESIQKTISILKGGLTNGYYR